jgi:hypothetical protein
MHRRWFLLLWLPTIVILAFATAFVARSAWVYSRICMIPSLTWIIGVILMWVGRPRVTEEKQLLYSRIAWFLLAYGVALALLNPMPWFPGSIDDCPAYIVLPLAPIPCGCLTFSLKVDRDYGMWWYVLLLAPLAWAAVSGSTRGEWLRSIGATLILFGQFFILNYNLNHATSGISYWYGWVY